MGDVNRTDIEHVPAQPPARLQLSDHEVDLIKSTVLAGQQVSDAEFGVFLRASEHLGLDPLMKQIYGIKRQGRLTIQVGIDGYRLIADRTGRMIGSDRPTYGPVDGRYPEWAEVTVRKLVAGGERAFTGVAYWDEFYPGDGGQGAMWRQMPRTMLAKCAEAQALRKAFPANLAGTYTPDEMAQSGQDDPLRPYRDDLIARARALPETHRRALKQNRVDPRTAEADQLRAFEAELAALEDEADSDGVEDAVLVDDESPSSGAGDVDGRSGSAVDEPVEVPPASTEGPGGPVAPRPRRTSSYDVDASDRRALRAKIRTPIQATLEAARFDPSPLDLATRAGLKATAGPADTRV